MNKVTLGGMAVAFGLLAAACGGGDGGGNGGAKAAGSTSPPAAAAPAPAASPSAAGAKVAVAKTKFGMALVDEQGHSLYLFEKDEKDESYCSGACAESWPPAITQGAPQAGAGVTASRLGTITRKDGQSQVTYGGHPLYTYEDDVRPGDVKGQDSKEFGADWYLVGADGKGLEG